MAKSGLPEMIEKLHWLGHASFRYDGSKMVYFDPWKLPAGARKADIILISHEHFDHFSYKDIALIAGKDTVAVTNAEVAGELKKKGFPGRVESVSAGSSRDIDGVRITAVPSYNIGKSFHPEGAGKLGFVISIDGCNIYHAGDTDNIPEIAAVKCDIALLPVSGTYVMTAEEAAGAATAMKPKVAVPMHYGDIVGSASDAAEFKSLLKGKVEVMVLKKDR